ncbi:MAG TPA: lysophospholipid acyltransferase family protein [Acidimicrobiales bacterium]|jgi:1-acyl-sn-glycerol-3-phosphate acyltransferase|nr:lysophospholipid acyltransferase family protein [Acidimicrobiales bacterium]
MRPPSRAELRWYAVARALVAGFCAVFWRVSVTGAEHVPNEGPFVLAPVHRSYVDTLFCGCVTRRRLRFMGKDSLWNHTWSGRLVSSLGAFPVHRGSVDREALRASEEAIRNGEPVVIYPEGERKSGPMVHPLRDGAAFVAARTGVPIVPVAIGGSEWAMPKGARFFRPVKVAIAVGPPIPAPARAEGARVPRRHVAEVSDALHAELQRLFDQALTDAGRR